MKQNSNWPQYLPTLLIQQIRLQWYKDCRGGNAAAQRNQYPKAMRLPKDFFSYRDHADPHRGGIERPCLGRGIPRLRHRESGI